MEFATAPPLRRSYSDRAVTSPGGAFQTDTSLANHRHRTRLLADCQWRCRWRCGLGRLRNTRSLTEIISRDRRKLIKLILRKWTFLPPRSHLIRQFVKRHLVTLRREQHVLAQWLRQYFCQDPGVRSVGGALLYRLVIDKLSPANHVEDSAGLIMVTWRVTRITLVTRYLIGRFNLWTSWTRGFHANFQNNRTGERKIIMNK